jgi:hypothetical protein
VKDVEKMQTENKNERVTDGFTEESVLLQAQAILAERGKAYGVEDSFGLIAQFWKPIFGTEVTAKQVAMAMIGLKMARELGNHKHDNLIDIAGYTECLARLHRS